MLGRHVSFCKSLKSPSIPSALALGLFMSLASLSCSQDDSRKETAPGLPSGGTAGGGTEGGGAEEEVEPGKGVADSLSFGSLVNTSLFTKSAAENTCVTFEVNTTNAGKPAGDVDVSFSIQAGNVPLSKDPGTLTPDKGKTDADGKLSSIYCSGEAVGSVVLVAKAGEVSSNSGKIRISKKPDYDFKFVRSDADPELRTGEGAKSSDSVIYLNLLDSGPQDCTQVYFKLTQAGSPLVGESLTFSTQVDFPKGAKLGKREDSLQTATNSVTGKKYATFTATSSGAGEFAVPVCAGVSLGSLQISGTYTDPDGVLHQAQSPVIRITAGLTNYINMSLTFDSMNARTLKAYYNTNSSYQLPVSVQLGARYDGDPLTQYPVSIATEVGRVIIENGGTPDKETGAVKVKLQSLHLVDQYPYFVQAYNGYPLAQTRCEPSSLAQWGASQSLASVNYSDIRRNWRSTMVYSIRGQEHYHDANRNGVYDVGGDGFWDKNQNGIFDSGDALTYDAGNDGVFNPLSEWFIDLPSPFVDVDEDGIFDSSKDILIGDEYKAPSGKRESDALLWKYEYFPISMGASAYGMQRYRINTSAYNSADTSVAVTGGGTYDVFGLATISATDLWGGAVTPAEGRYRSVIFAHDLCGNLLPGGTELSMQFITATTPAWGARNPLAYYYTQPGDYYLEPARHLIKAGDSGSKAIINFNATDHPASAQSYPVVGSIEVPACTNTCTGAVVAANPGVSCDGWAGIAKLAVKEPKLDEQGVGTAFSIDVSMSFGSYQACNCVATATQSAGVCACPANTTFDAATASCI